jgi:hypothetical protein
VDGCAVSPGLRANNFYDNFRSFSRQNQFSLPAMQQRAAQRPPAEPLPANNAATGTGSYLPFTLSSVNKHFFAVLWIRITLMQIRIRLNTLIGIRILIFL